MSRSKVGEPACVQKRPASASVSPLRTGRWDREPNPNLQSWVSDRESDEATSATRRFLVRFPHLRFYQRAGPAHPSAPIVRNYVKRLAAMACEDGSRCLPNEVPGSANFHPDSRQRQQAHAQAVLRVQNKFPTKLLRFSGMALVAILRQSWTKRFSKKSRCGPVTESARTGTDNTRQTASQDQIWKTYGFHSNDSVKINVSGKATGLRLRQAELA